MSASARVGFGQIGLAKPGGVLGLRLARVKMRVCTHMNVFFICLFILSAYECIFYLLFQRVYSKECEYI